MLLSKLHPPLFVDWSEEWLLRSLLLLHVVRLEEPLDPYNPFYTLPTADIFFLGLSPKCFSLWALGFVRNV